MQYKTINVSEKTWEKLTLLKLKKKCKDMDELINKFKEVKSEIIIKSQSTDSKGAGEKQKWKQKKHKQHMKQALAQKKL